MNGLINDKRGKRDEPQLEPEKSLSNNAVFMKLKIALNLKADDVIKILSLAGLKGMSEDPWNLTSSKRF